MNDAAFEQIRRELGMIPRDEVSLAKYALQLGVTVTELKEAIAKLESEKK